MVNNYVKNLLGDQEKIILVTRQHGFILLSNMLLEIFLILLIATAVIAATFFLPDFSFTAVLYILLIVPLIGMIRDFLIWRNNQYIVTNRRVIQIAGVFNKNVTDSSLEKVNDVKMEQSALGRLFNYGDVEILTASELGANLFKQIGNPVRFKTAMLNAKEQMGHGEIGVIRGEEGARPSDIPAMIARLDQLRQQGVLTEAEFQQKKAELLAKM